MRAKQAVSWMLVVALVGGLVPGHLVLAGEVVVSDVKSAKNELLSVKEEKTDLPVEATPGYEDWLSGAQKEMVAEEYVPTLQTKDAEGVDMNEPAWHMVNREQGMRSYVGNTGWKIGPRDTTEGKDWSWRYALSTIGRGKVLTKIVEPASSDITSDDTGKVTIDHKVLSEWYLNSPTGIEQGFTVAKKPIGKGELEVVAKIDTDLKVRSFSDEQVTFSTDTRDELKLDKLKAWDVDGKDLPAKFKYDGVRSSLTIAINDAGAKYPITVDPLATSPSWTAESDQVNTSFGFSVASAGDVNGDGYSDVIVGAFNYDNGQTDEGRVFVYHGGASGLDVGANWTAESDQAGANFGRSVAGAGDVNGDGYSDVVIGSQKYDNGQTDEGRAYVYHGGSGGLAVTAAWTAESDQVEAFLGHSVASAGDVNGDGYSDVIISAYAYDNGQIDEGRAYVYHGGAGGLANGAAWTAESNQAYAQFSRSVASAGDVNGDGYSDVIVGVFLYDNGQLDEGRTYVYHGGVSGLVADATWIAESDQVEAYFGISVASAGDVNGDGYSDVIVGAYFYDNGQTDEGRAYVYHGSAGGLAVSATWTAESDQASAEFGVSVASAGDVNGDGYSDVIVGAETYDNGQTDEGRAYVYHGGASGLTAIAAWTAESNQISAFFGRAVASAGDVNGDGYSDVMVGAYKYDNGETDEGRAFVYLGSASGPATTTAWTAESDQVNARFGVNVASAGDVNGDGYSDAIVGSYFYDNGQTDEGRAYVYHGGASGLAASPAWTAESDQANAEFGYRVAGAGDVNGDGYADVIVSAYAFDNDQTDEGRIYVYHGGASGLSASAAWTVESDQADSHFGVSIASAGDVNGDGYSDVVVGAWSFDNGETNEGRAFVYHGGASGLSTSVAWTAEGDQTTATFGYSVAGAGDVNGDGYGDVIVGALGYDNGQTDEGRAFVYHGGASGLSTGSAWTAESDQVNAQFALVVASAGDVNGDGYSDVIVGSSFYDNGQAYEGRAFVYHGGASGLSSSFAWSAEGDQGYAEFGVSVASAGDVNGDGYSDVIVGAIYFDNGQTDEGRAYVYIGSASGLSVSAVWITESDQATTQYGFSVASAGDANGDGYSDVIVGAARFDNGESDEGRVFLYYGNGGAGLSVNPRQLTHASNPLPVLGRSGSNTFYISLKAKPVSGRGKVKLQWEVKPLGTNFNGNDLGTSTSWSDSTVSGVTITEAVGGLAANTRYHWRVRVISQNVALGKYSPWYSVGPNGWNEADLYMAVIGGGFVCPAPRIVVGGPNGGESYKTGDTPLILWTADGCQVEKVVITLSVDGGENYGEIANMSTPSWSSGFAKWTVPDVSTTRGRIRAQLYGTGNALIASDQSDSDFTISNGKVVVPPPTEVVGDTPSPTPSKEVIPPPPVFIGDVPAALYQEAARTAGLAIELKDEIGGLISNPNDVTGIDVAVGPQCEAGTALKGSASTVYYCPGDGTLRPFPNKATFISWFKDFSAVVVVDDSLVASMVIGPFITLRPGSTLIKTPGNPATYVVEAGSLLRQIPNEATAEAMFGALWRLKVIDVDPTFLEVYRIGAPLAVVVL